MIGTLESIQLLNEVLDFVSNLPEEVIIIGIAVIVYGLVKTSVDILRLGAMLNPAYWILRLLR